MRLRLLALALLITSPAFAIDVEFSAPRRTGPAAYDQPAPALASNGIGYLAAWTTYAPETHVYATYILTDGGVPDAIATQLDAGTQAKSAWGVSISAGRDGYFATWLTESGVTFAVLDSHGRVERTSSVTQVTSPTYGWTLTAWDGSTHLVLSSGYNFSGASDTSYYATLVDDNANVIASKIAVGNSGKSNWRTIVADGNGFLLISNLPGYAGNPDSIFGRRITPNGSMGDWFQIRTTASPITSIAAIYDGTHDLLVWADFFGIWTAELDPRTNALGASRQVSPAPQMGSLHMARSDNTTWIVWHGPAMTTFAMPLNADGSAGTTVSIGNGISIDIAAAAQTVLTVRSMERSSASPIYFGNLDVIGKFLTPNAQDFIVSKSQTNQANGDLASDGTTVLATWDEEIGTNREIFAARHFGSSAPADDPGVQLSAGGFNQFATAASNGKTWLVVWLHADTPNGSTAVAVARRFSSDGHVIDSEDIVLGPASVYSNRLRVASDGSSWLVAWLDRRQGGWCGSTNVSSMSTRPVFTRVTSDGIALDEGGIDVAPQIALETTDVDIAWDGSNYVAAWANYCWYGGHSSRYTNVSGAFISPDLTKVELLPLSGAPVVAGATMPRVIARDANALFAWNHSGTTEYEVIHDAPASRPARTRAVGTPRVIRNVEGSLVGVSLARTGELMIFTRKKIPWAVNDGVFYSIPDTNGTIIGSGLGAILDGGEQFGGHVARTGAYAWIATTRFSAPAGANREWMTAVDSPR